VSFFKLETIDRLITLQQQQMQLWKELVMLEQRILCKFLPKSFDHVTLNDLGSTEGGNGKILQVKEKQKKLQQMKRAKIDSLFQTYEYKILDCEH
jgi:hypothetical protein